MSGCGSVPAIASPSACSALVSSAGRRSSISSACWRNAKASSSSIANARATLPSAAAAAAATSGSSAAAPVAAAMAARDIGLSSGRNVRMRQRERKVASTRAAEWLTNSSSARCGGSSSTLSSALAPEALSSSTASTMAIAPAPSPARRAEKRHGAADVVDRDLLVQHALVVERALENEQIGLPLRGDAARHRMRRDRRQATLPPRLRAPPDRDAPARSAPCGKPASPCRCLSGRRSEMHAARGRRDRPRATPPRRAA